MISSSQSKLIRSLQHKKYRQELRLFPVEGEKLVGELLQGDPSGRFQIREVFATREWIAAHPSLQLHKAARVTEATPSEFRKISTPGSPQPVMALVSIPEDEFHMEELLHKPVLAFESIRDPGNLGTILRTADWFGIGQVVCRVCLLPRIGHVQRDHISLQHRLQVNEGIVAALRLQRRIVHQAIHA